MSTIRTCPICTALTDDAVGDHCHNTGVPREFICRSCNAGLGMFKDSPAALRAAAEYLERHAAGPRTTFDFCAAQLKAFHPRQQQRKVRAALLADERKS